MAQDDTRKGEPRVFNENQKSPYCTSKRVLPLGNTIERLRVNDSPAVEHPPEKSRTAGDPVGDTARDHHGLSRIELYRARFRMIQRVTAELEVDFVLVTAAVKAALRIVHVDAQRPLYKIGALAPPFPVMPVK